MSILNPEQWVATLNPELRDVRADWEQSSTCRLLKLQLKHGNGNVTKLWLTEAQAEYVAKVVEGKEHP